MGIGVAAIFVQIKTEFASSRGVLISAIVEGGLKHCCPFLVELPFMLF